MIFARFLLVAVAIPFALAGGNNNSGSECSSKQFKWAAKNCCLDYGGPPSHETPPAGNDCPSSWSWKSEKGCCTPHQPPAQLPPPQCNHGWNWSDATYSCCPNSTPTPTITPHQPSATPDNGWNNGGGSNNGGSGNNNNNNGGHNNGGGNNGGGYNGHNKRSYRSRAAQLCPQGSDACAVSSFSDDIECVDTVSDLDNCGGCAITGEGENCNAIVGAWNVGCERGSCKVYNCAEGYRMAQDGSCVSIFTTM